jgi:outer membrane receptor protein involved in Fe transport
MKFTPTPLLLSLCLFFCLSSSAQSTYGVKGAIIDSSSNIRLANTTICVLNAKDSTLRQFTRAAANGSFAINNLKKGKFILLVSFPGYADYVEHFSLDSIKTQRDFGRLSLTLKSKILQEVLIKGTVAAIKIKGDTTEFNAKAYTIQPNSKVEDLLKQLPGIQVDKDGKITAQGQTVSKVLVDGEEFFGDDPTLVTKNIRGDMVDKVQLYDKKSDQAAFTGIDDGQKTKTINIKLKEDKKNGYFGKLDGAIGTDKYYQEQAMYNKFQGKKKFSAYGILSNTGKTGLGWEDSNKYGTSTSEVTDDGGIIFFGGSGNDLDSFDGRYNGEGIPVAKTGGLHYDNKWDTDKKSINTNYKAGSLEVDGTKNTQVQNNLPAGIINSNSNQDFRNSVFRQKMDVMYQVKLDTASNLKFTVDATLKNSKTNSSYLSASTNGANALLNTNNRKLTNDVDNQIFNASVFYTHKFKKVGRTVSANLSGNINQSDAEGYLNSAIAFYNKTSGLIDSTQSTNQYKVTDTKAQSITSNFTYTEPLTKKASLSFNYGLGYNNSNADRKSFNQTTPGVYNQLDTKYSNDYTIDQLSNAAGATFNYRTAKATLNFGARATDVNFKQIDENTGQAYTRSFLNWNPNATYQYRFTQQRSIRLYYYGNTTQPSIDQIQPIRVNTDPLNISLGNPDLKPSFRNTLSLSYNSYKVLSDQSLYLYTSFNFVNRAIVNNNTTDSTGKTTYQSINLNGRQPYSFNINASYGQKFNSLGGINVRIGAYSNGSRSFNYSNSILNTTNSNSYSAQLGISKYKQKKFDFYVSAGPGYTISGSSLQKSINNNGYTFNGYAYFNYYFPGKIQLSSDANYDYRGKTQAFEETFSKAIVNASINKTFLKQDNLKLSLAVNDLLNQNRGFDRSSYSGNITQNTYTTIKRYFLFSITWDFNKMGGGAPQPK